MVYESVELLRAFDDGKIFAKIDGHGLQLVVALHGWSRTSNDFLKLVSTLDMNRFRLVRFDLPGFGESAPPDEPVGTQYYASAIDRAICELLSGDDAFGEDSRVILVGHSFGGRIAIRIGAARPKWLGSLVVSGVPLFRGGSSRSVPLSLSIAKFLASKGIIGAPRLDKIKSKHGSLDYRNAQGVIRDILVKSVNEDYSDALSMIEVDTFLIWGALDSAAPIDMARRALEILPRGKLDVIADGDHFAIFSDRSSLSKTIDEISNNRLGTL